MIQGLYAAATGLMAVEQRQSVVANNIANAATAGFKRQESVDRGFNTILLNSMRSPFWMNRIEGPGGGLQINETYTDLTGGPVVRNEDPLSVAVQGPGYIAVETEKGERFTRNGSLAVDATGQLRTSDGDAVLRQGGATIVAPQGPVQIQDDGSVLANGQVVGQIRVVEFDNPHMLTREGHNLYRASEEAMAASKDAVETTLVPESVELSNVQIPREMVEMISGVRNYEANQRVITTVDDTISRLIEQVGTPL